MTSQDVHSLFSETLLGDYDDDAPWEAVHSLRRIGSREIFNQAAEWCHSNNPLVRARGLDILSQLGKTADCTNSFPEESYALASDLVACEEDLRALESGIFALGHLDNPLAIPSIITFCAHPSAEIRFSVTCALGSFPDDPRSVSALLLLMDDADEDVRDWATFGIGSQSDCDSTHIREALLKRLSDPNENVRGEAIVGLGKRRDERVLPYLLGTLENALERPPASSYVSEAAYLMLSMEVEPQNWVAADYLTALRERYKD